MKKILYAVLPALACVAMLSASVHASECGQALTSSKVAYLQAPLTSSIENLSQLQDGLLQEEKTLLSSDSAVGWDKLETELSLVGTAMNGAELLEKSLDEVLILSQVKEVMVNDKDRQSVEKFRVIAMRSLAPQASRLSESTGRSLVRAQRPAVAVELGKLRDSLSTIGQFFDPCKKK